MHMQVMQQLIREHTKLKYTSTILNERLKLAGLESIYPGMKVEPRPQLSAGQLFGKTQVLAKSKNQSKLSLFRFHYTAWFLYFCTFPSMLRHLSSESFNKL